MSKLMNGGKGGVPASRGMSWLGDRTDKVLVEDADDVGEAELYTSGWDCGGVVEEEMLSERREATSW